MRRFAAIGLFAAVLSAVPGVSLRGQQSNVIQVICASYEHVSRTLARRYGEAPIMRGIIIGGSGLFELWRGRNGATFTALIHYTDDSACLISAGTDLGEVAWVFYDEVL